MDPFGCEGRDRGGPRELNSVCQDKPSSRVNRSLLDPLLFLGLLLAALLLELLLPLLLRLLLREEDVGDRYVDLGYAKADQALYPVGHVAPHGLGELGYRFAVLGRQRQVEGGLSGAPKITGHKVGLFGFTLSAPLPDNAAAATRALTAGSSVTRRLST